MKRSSVGVEGKGSSSCRRRRRRRRSMFQNKYLRASPPVFLIHHPSYAAWS